jgi:hypothetical protein
MTSCITGSAYHNDLKSLKNKSTRRKKRRRKEEGKWIFPAELTPCILLVAKLAA